jgi:hypothetical protein
MKCIWGITGTEKIMPPKSTPNRQGNFIFWRKQKSNPYHSFPFQKCSAFFEIDLIPQMYLRDREGKDFWF